MRRAQGFEGSGFRARVVGWMVGSLSVIGVAVAGSRRSMPRTGASTMSPLPYAEEFRKAAHDIRTPLAAVTQGVDALLHLGDETPEGALHLFDIVRRNVVLMGEVLATSLERGRSLSANPVEVDLGGLARDVADLIQPVLSARRQTVDVVVTGRAARVVGDYGGLARVLLNLLDNASKYGPGGEELRIRVRRRDSFTVVSVHDHGPGIPRGERHAIFRAFYRTEA